MIIFPLSQMAYKGVDTPQKTNPCFSNSELPRRSLRSISAQATQLVLRNSVECPPHDSGRLTWFKFNGDESHGIPIRKKKSLKQIQGS